MKLQQISILIICGVEGNRGIKSQKDKAVEIRLQKGI